MFWKRGLTADVLGVFDSVKTVCAFQAFRFVFTKKTLTRGRFIFLGVCKPIIGLISPPKPPSKGEKNWVRCNAVLPQMSQCRKVHVVPHETEHMSTNTLKGTYAHLKCDGR